MNQFLRWMARGILAEASNTFYLDLPQIPPITQIPWWLRAFLIGLLAGVLWELLRRILEKLKRN